MLGFTFKDKHSSAYGVSCRTKARTLLPEVKSYTYDTPLSDGAYDMTEVNRFGRAFYKNRTFDMTLFIQGDNLTELERKAARVAVWLSGSGKLSFDDAKIVQWDVRIVSDVAFTPERGGKKAELSVIFQSAPIGEATFNTIDGIRLKDAVYLDSDIPLDMSGYFVKSLTSGSNAVDFVNLGDFYVRPQLEFIGDMKNITVSFGDSKIILEDLTGNAVIDLEKCIVTDGNGNSLLGNMQGDFFELPAGRSVLQIYTDEPCTLSLRYTPRTIYDFDFSEIDWGDADAETV